VPAVLLVGGVWFVYCWLPCLVAVVVGFIALAGVATEFGVVMLLYLDTMIASFKAEGG